MVPAGPATRRRGLVTTAARKGTGKRIVGHGCASRNNMGGKSMPILCVRMMSMIKDSSWPW